MSTQKRERELAKAKFERQQANRAARAVRAKRNQRITAVVVVVALIAAGVGFAVFNASNSDSPAITAETAPVDLNEVNPSGNESQVEATALDCTEPGTPRANDISYPDGPLALDTNPTSMVLNTNCGVITIALDPNAPETVASEAFLAQSGFYDDTTCHRLTTEGISSFSAAIRQVTAQVAPGTRYPTRTFPLKGKSITRLGLSPWLMLVPEPAGHNSSLSTLIRPCQLVTRSGDPS